MVPSYSYTALKTGIHTENQTVYESLWQLVPLLQQRCFRALGGSGGRRGVAVVFPRASQTRSVGFRAEDLAGQSIIRIYWLSWNSSTRWALFESALLFIKVNKDQGHTWKGEHRVPRYHIYTSHQSQSLCQTHGGVCAYRRWCLPKPSNLRSHIDLFLLPWSAGSGSLVFPDGNTSRISV